VVVVPAGVFVVGVHHDGGRVERRFSGGWHSRVEHLYVGGRDRTASLAELAEQRNAVASALADGFVNVPVAEAICFVGGLFAHPLRVGDVHVVSPGALVELLRAPGGLGADAVARVERQLALALPV